MARDTVLTQAAREFQEVVLSELMLAPEKYTTEQRRALGSCAAAAVELCKQVEDVH